MLADFQTARNGLCGKWMGSPELKSCEQFLEDFTLLVDRYILSGCRKGWPGAGKEIALVALGGYGRQEMYPNSDIDLMLLFDASLRSEISGIADAVFYPLWDTGLDLGHGVRTVEESIGHAAEDFFFRVALLDSRLLYGSERLFADLQASFRQKHITGQRKEFVVQMKELRHNRLERFGRGSYLLEPHIKEGRGGMRDVQSMLWVGRVVFGLCSLEEFRDAGLMLPAELEELLGALRFLGCLRMQLHFLSNRKNDQIYLEQQSELASVFGYRDGRGVRGVERFMADVYRSLQTVNVSANLFFEHVDEVLGLFEQKGKVADKILEKGVEIRGGRITLAATEEQVQKKPQTLMRVFLAMARTGLPLHHRTRRHLPGLLTYFGDKERHSPRLAKAFFAAMLEAKKVLDVLMAMLETGMLTAVIPEFSRVDRLAQHDLYHIYTVDRHSLQTVCELHRELRSETQSAGKLVGKLNALKIVYLAALLHDIGKGSGRDHSEEGAVLARGIGSRLSMNEQECDTLEFLVRYHLFIPENALRRDLDDSVFIAQCAELIGSRERLGMLYLLSVADAQATGPSAWSEWKAALMEDMYLRISALLAGGEGVKDAAVHEQEGVQWLREQVRAALSGEEGLKIDPETLSDDYVLAFSPEIIVHHLLVQRDNYQRVRQLSLLEARPLSEGWEVLVMTVDRSGILAKICGVFTLNNLSVSRAHIFTWADGTVVDVLTVKAAEGIFLSEVDWGGLRDQLDRVLSHRMSLGEKLHSKLLGSRRKRNEKLVGELESKVLIDNEASEKYTVVEVHAADLPGQLYHITQRLADFGVQIHRAYIATEVELLIDVFYVQDKAGRKLEDSEEQAKIIAVLLDEIEA